MDLRHHSRLYLTKQRAHERSCDPARPLEVSYMPRTEAEILADVKRLAVEYYELTEKPLGVTGEVAEVAAAEKLGLELAPARTEGYDATRPGGERVQIKGRRIVD